MAFAVDTSGSIGLANFNQIKEFLYIVVRDHDVGEDFAHFAVVHFSDNASVLFNFNRLRGADLTAANVNNLISTLPYDGGETSIDLALIRAHNQIFSNAGGWRPAQNLPKVLVVITDGQQTPRGDQSANLTQLAANLKSKGVVIITVGIGSGVNTAELVQIAQGVADNVIEIDDFALLKNKTDTLIERSCRAPNECDLYSPCHANATCTDTEVSFICKCIDGHTGDGVNCVDLDECSGSNPCIDGSTCVNTDGGYQCRCPAGREYDYQNNVCQDVDECARNLYTCHAYAGCVNTDGSYNCVCNIGYTGDGNTSCVDIDECSTEPEKCDRNADCNNTVGSYNCTCRTGYYGDGIVNCRDVNECASNPCKDGLMCTNTQGSHICYQCIANTNLVNGECIDVNECDGNHSCPVGSVCSNRYGSHRCNCPAKQAVYRGMCVDVLIYNVELDTDESYKPGHADPNSPEFGILAGPIEDYVKNILDNSQLANDTVDVVLTRITDEDGNARAHISVLLKKNARTPATDVQRAVQDGVNNNDMFGGIKVTVSSVGDFNECAQTPAVCPVDQTCANEVGSFRCYCKDANHIVMNGACVESNVYEGTIAIVEGLTFNTDLNDPESVMYGSVSQDIEEAIMMLVNQQSSADNTAENILGVQTLGYTEGSVIVHLLFYVRRTSTINMRHVEIFLNNTIPIINGKQVLGGQYVIKSISVSDHNECTFNHNILPKAECGFGDCVNVVGSYRCHCTGDVDTQSGACVPPITVNDLLQAVPEEADDDKWWVVYAVVFGVLFVIIFLLLVALCCIECSGGSNKERYLVHSQYELNSGQHGYHHDIRIDDEVAPGNPKSYKMQNDYTMGDEVIAYKTPGDTKSGFYEINPIYDDNKGGTIRTEKSYSSVTTTGKGSVKSETESAYHSTANDDDSPSTSPPVS